jgi:hypothetical protein
MNVIRTTIAASLVVASLGLPSHAAAPSASSAPSPSELDRLLAPIALYPDQLLAQILLCASDSGSVVDLQKWLTSNQSLQGTDLQDAAMKAGFDPSCVSLVLFPQVVKAMADNLDRTVQVSAAFAADRTAVFDSIQRLRTKAKDTGALKTTPQQEVETRTTSGGQQVIVIEPANPQVVYVPQYNPQVVYTQPATSTVVVQDDDDSDELVAGMIGFTAGVALGAAFDNDYYYGPYGWGGGVYMYNDAWDDWYDHREDAREDWMEHREDVAGERGDRANTRQEQRTDRQTTRQDTRGDSQAQRTERRDTRQAERPTSTAERGTRGTTGQTQSARTSATATDASRGYGGQNARATAERSGTRSDAFSGYSSGRSERTASSRGQSSMSSSRSRSGGARTGGGRRR